MIKNNGKGIENGYKVIEEFNKQKRDEIQENYINRCAHSFSHVAGHDFFDSFGSPDKPWVSGFSNRILKPE